MWFQGILNKMIVGEQYPLQGLNKWLPKWETNCKEFAKLGIEKAYHQLELVEEVQKYLIINTKKACTDANVWTLV